MHSLRELYRIGHGPSSSHTMGPRLASGRFRTRYAEAADFAVHLYGSLAATGQGHLTDRAVCAELGEETTVNFHDEVLSGHPNGMRFEAFAGDGTLLGEWTVYSIGGGALSETGSHDASLTNRYPDRDIAALLNAGVDLAAYVYEHEDGQFPAYLDDIWRVMQDAVARGLRSEGVLPGALSLQRRAASIATRAHAGGNHEHALIAAAAFAVSEENAAGGRIVTAPSCGACGVMPGVLSVLAQRPDIHAQQIRDALAIGGLFGNQVKHRASISGAEVGCQGEVGTACAMAAAAACRLLGGNDRQVECAAEMGLEHHLGLTCDPVLGLVQIPCIERNALAATRALDCAELACIGDGHHRVGFDACVAAMRQTGRDLLPAYRETATGGLAIQLLTSEDGGAPCA